MAEIIPAILAHNLETYRNYLQQVEGLVKKIHLDIMDGRFVPNTTIRINDIKDIQTTLRISAHLMVVSPLDYFPSLEIAKIKEVIIHYESFENSILIPATIATARKYNLRILLALNPETNEEVLKDQTSLIDGIVVMTVKPGFGGQEVNLNTLGKIARINRIYPNLPITVDGGIKTENIRDYYQAGARNFVIGSSIFSGKPKFALAKFQEIIDQLEIGL